MLTKNLVMAFVYFVFAKAAGIIAIPPGYATVVWPAAGVAFFALYRWGQFLWPGVLIGSTFFNFFVSSDYQNRELFFINLFMSLIIGLGASLQAIVSSQIGRVIVKKEDDILVDKNLISILFFSGPGACLISATFGAIALLSFGKISTAQFFSTWGTWYIGDSTGVLVFAPICFVLMTNTFGNTLNKKLVAFLPLLIAFIVTVGVYLIVLKTEKKQAYLRFYNSSNQIVSILNNHLSDYEMILRFVESFHQSSDFISKNEFRTFTHSMFNWTGGVFAIAWAPRVSFENLNEFTKDIKKIYPNFNIIERNELGEFTNVAKRSFYFPVVYAEPFEEGRKGAIGFDLTSQLDRRLAILQSMDRGTVVATAPIKLVSDDQKQDGIVIFLPVYKSRIKKFENFQGVYLLAVRFVDVIQLVDQSIINQFDYFEVNDITDATAPQPLFSNNPDQKLDFGDQGIAIKQRVSFAQRIYEVKTYSSFVSLYSSLTWTLWLALAFGMLLTGVLGAFILMLFGRSRLLEIEVAKVSAEINQQRLKMEEISRFRSLGIMAGGVAHEINNPLMIITGNASVLNKMLEKENVKNPKVYESLGKINKTVERISRIVKGLLTLSRDSSQDPMESVSVAKLIDLGCLLLGEKFKAYGIPLRFSGDMDAQLECKVAQVSQIFTALLQNSIEAVKNQNSSWVEVKAIDHGDSLAIEVVDSGSGLSIDVQEKLFTPFFTTKDVGEGTGLGLSIARGVVESHGGTLRYDSTCPNTKFVVVLPKKQAKVLKFM
ncbi:MAG: hypothetical protein Fur0010_25140 [Bdellovibrio sp.]